MTSKIDELKNELEQLKAQVAQAMGITTPPSGDPKDRADYIEHGSPAHAQFLGLVLVDGEDDPTGYVVYKSRDTGNTWRLVDEIEVLTHYPGVDPDKAALMVLRQKIGELEAGKPEAPTNAPSTWQPVDQFVTQVRV